MKLSNKAAMFSAIVFPGAGYFVVKKTIRGVVSLVVTIGCLSYPMTDVFQRAVAVRDKIINGEIPIDIVLIREQILLTPGSMTQQDVSTLSLLIAVVWLVSIIDSYLIGRRSESKTQKSNI
ncbi:MAG: hypothetical protein OEY29_04975 [Gammaproteobacteria bacterium]|nr:hypothetical protein [Gammaproteobacteria bacterium]